MRYSSIVLTMSLAGSILVSCSGSGIAGEYDVEHGPFDANGNYIEAWANGRPKSSWKKKKAQVAKKKPAAKEKKPSIVRAKKSEKPEWLSKKPSKQKPKSSTTSQKTTKPQYAAKSKPKTQPSKSKATPPKPKPVVIKTKVKPPVRHTVAKGDTLYNISRRYGSTVNSIQKANRLSGTNIRLGQVLMVPVR